MAPLIAGHKLSGITLAFSKLNIMAQTAPNSEHADPYNTLLRRRRIVSILSLCLLLMVIGVVAGIIWRPLTATEQRLVGTWCNSDKPAFVFTFHSDRTISAPPRVGVSSPPTGSWYIHNNKLYTPNAAILEAIETLFGGQIDDSTVLTFIDDNNISTFTPINGGTGKWRRVADP